MPEALARKVKRAAGKQPVSAWLTQLVEKQFNEDEYERLWKEHFEDIPMTPAQRREGDAIFARLTKPRGRRRRAA